MTEIAELDTVRLRRAHGRWAAGARGVVVNHRPGWPVATVDFSELVPLAERDTLDFFELVLEIDVADLERVEAPGSESDGRRPVGRSSVEPGPAIEVRGRRAWARSVWQVAAIRARPRLITAYPCRPG